MNVRSAVRALFAAALVGAAFGSPGANAQTQAEAPAEDVVEKIAVRNRLYNVGGRFEAGAGVGFMVLNKLTDHVMLSGFGAWNVTDTLAFELRAGYGLSRHTGLANQVAQQLLTRNPANEVKKTDDLANLWELNGNAMLGARWQPLYGKLNLVAELPVHFQWYLWAGGGAGQFKRESVVYCQSLASRSEGTCNEWLNETKFAPVGSFAMGLRLFTHSKGGIKLELRDYVFPDSYRVGIERDRAEAGQETGTNATSPGLTQLWMIDIGYAYIF